MSSSDLAASLGLLGALSIALGAHLVASLLHGRPLVASRVERETGLPIVGRAPMHAVYWTLGPVARALVRLRVSANAVTLAAGVIALGAGAAFATGHFGVGAAIASVASLADGLDGFVARTSGTQSRFGRVLDTTVDRYVDAILLGGVAIHVRQSAALLTLALAAIVGSFMVSYASSVERELGFEAGATPMRRTHRLVFLLLATALAPIAAEVTNARAGLPVVFVAVTAIAVLANVSAVRRLLRAGRAMTSGPLVPPPAPASDPPPKGIATEATEGR